MKQTLTLIELVNVEHNYGHSVLSFDTLNFTQILESQHLLPGSLIIESSVNDVLIFNEAFEYQINGVYTFNQSLTFNDILTAYKVLSKSINQSLILSETVLGTSTLEHSILSIQNGNWNNITTWAGGIVPGEGDSVVVNHNVTINVDTTVTTLNVIDGILTIDGVILTVMDSATFGKPNMGVIVYRLIIINDGGIVNGNLDIAAILTVNEDTGIQIIGPTIYDLS